jgi:hypothetical protein
MPDDQARTAGPDPGLHEEPSEEELDAEDGRRDEMTVEDMILADLRDPATPSRPGEAGGFAPGSFDVPLQERSRERTDGR